MTDPREDFIFRLVRPFYFLDPLALRDVFDCPFIIKDRSGGVADGSRVFANANFTAVGSINLVFEQFYKSVRFNASLEFLPFFWIDIDGLTDVAHTRDQLLRRVMS